MIYNVLKKAMKNLIIRASLIFFTVNLSYSQEWMTSLEIAQKLALMQNKTVLMVWEEATKYPYLVYVDDEKGGTIVIGNLFEDEKISQLIWKNFVPVIVSESQHASLYKKVKGKRKQRYIDKFNDDSIKIMDANGNIINTSYVTEDYLDIAKLIKNYALNTQLVTLELEAYKKEKNFYSAYYLASKYLDLSVYVNEAIRSEIIDLSNIYLDEAIDFLEIEATEDKSTLKQRAELLKIQEYLILNRPKRVLRELKKMEAENIESTNEALVNFLYYTAYSILKDEKNIELWKTKVSLLNLKKAQMIININT